MFHNLVRPHLEYASAIWDPHFQTDIDIIDRVQKRAARYATNNYITLNQATQKRIVNPWNGTLWKKEDYKQN